VLHLVVEAGVQLGAYAMDHALGREEVDRHVGQHELDGLEIADRPAELDAPGGIIVADLLLAVIDAIEFVGEDVLLDLGERLLAERRSSQAISCGCSQLSANARARACASMSAVVSDTSIVSPNGYASSHCHPGRAEREPGPMHSISVEAMAHRPRLKAGVTYEMAR
jgi:hypothetical protein